MNAEQAWRLGDLEERVSDFLRRLMGPVIPKFFIAGGAIRDIMDGTEIRNDVDVYFYDPKDVELVFAALREGQDERHEVASYLTVFADTIDALSFQKRTFASARLCIEQFDFTVCQFAYADGQLVQGQNSLSDLEDRVLSIHALPAPLHTLARLEKYIEYGFTIEREELLKIGAAIHAMGVAGLPLPELPVGGEIEYPGLTHD